MNILFNLRNKDYQSRIIILDYLRRELSTGKYYAGRYSNPIDNGNEYFRLDRGSLQSWVLIPKDLFDLLITKTFKARDGSIIDMKIDRSIIIQEDAHTDNPKYYKMSIGGHSVKFNSNFKVDYSKPKTILYKVRKSNSLGGFIKITNTVSEDATFDFSTIEKMAENNQHI